MFPRSVSKKKNNSRLVLQILSKSKRQGWRKD